MIVKAWLSGGQAFRSSPSRATRTEAKQVPPTHLQQQGQVGQPRLLLPLPTGDMNSHITQ